MAFKSTKNTPTSNTKKVFIKKNKTNTKTNAKKNNMSGGVQRPPINNSRPRPTSTNNNMSPNNSKLFNGLRRVLSTRRQLTRTEMIRSNIYRPYINNIINKLTIIHQNNNVIVNYSNNGIDINFKITYEDGDYHIISLNNMSRIHTIYASLSHASILPDVKYALIIGEIVDYIDEYFPINE